VLSTDQNEGHEHSEAKARVAGRASTRELSSSTARRETGRPRPARATWMPWSSRARSRAGSRGAAEVAEHVAADIGVSSLDRDVEGLSPLGDHALEVGSVMKWSAW